MVDFLKGQGLVLVTNSLVTTVQVQMYTRAVSKT